MSYFVLQLAALSSLHHLVPNAHNESLAQSVALWNDALLETQIRRRSRFASTELRIIYFGNPQRSSFNHGSKTCLTKKISSALFARHTLRAVQAAGILGQEDRDQLKLRVYNPWPLAHSAHLGNARPVRLGEEPDWLEAADSLRADFGAKYTPEQVARMCLTK